MITPQRLEELRQFGTGDLMPGGDEREVYYRACILELVASYKWQLSEWDRSISRMKSSVSAAENLVYVLQGHLGRSKTDRGDSET